MKSVIESWRKFLDEEEPYQRRQRLKHPRVKKDLIGRGGNDMEAGPFTEEPKMKRSKSAPPGFGAVGEAYEDGAGDEADLDEGTRLGDYNYKSFIDDVVKLNNKKVYKWAKLRGRSKLLGKGSQGIAYRMYDIVIKYTVDADEANSAAGIIDIEHPNLYNIHRVGELKDVVFQGDRVYVVIYDYLDPPNELMKRVAEQFKSHATNIFYQWSGEQVLYEAFEYLVGFKQHTDSLAEALSETERQFGYSLNSLVDLVWMVIHSLPKANMEVIEEEINDGTFVNNDIVELIIKYMNGLGAGLTALENAGIQYADLWEENVMQKDGEIVIIDIGYSRSAMQDIEQIVERKYER